MDSTRFDLYTMQAIKTKRKKDKAQMSGACEAEEDDGKKPTAIESHCVHSHMYIFIYSLCV